MSDMLVTFSAVMCPALAALLFLNFVLVIGGNE